ncbi:MAG: hypothetical protein AABW61_01330 [Candidatus Aenigmatarchaeota archaeon]
MGIDIHGWTIIRPYKNDKSYWRKVINIDGIVGRNSSMFDYLFGIGGYGYFKPVAENRRLPKELPKDIDPLLKGELLEESKDNIGISWLDWTEIKKIKWNKKPDGMMSDRINKELLRNDIKKRRLALAGDWGLLFKIMKSLAQKYGDENVRIIVWFCN